MTFVQSQSDCESMRVKLTVQALHGIKVNEEILNSHDVTAAVAFAGSASDMEVSSSTLCSTSGRLMVVSQPLPLIYSKNSSLSASWPEKEDSTAKENLPHVSFSMPVSHQSQPIPLSRSNRECCVVEELRDVESQLKTSSTSNDKDSTPPSLQCGSLEARVPFPSNAPLQTNEALWSSSRAFLPEIIDLTVKVRVAGEEESQDPHGKAFLVIFGHQETGTFVIDLPVRLLKKSVDDETTVGLAKDARLVVKVQLLPQTVRHETTRPTLSVRDAQSPKSDESNLTSSTLEAKISCLLATIEKNEKEVKDFLRAQKHAMDVVVPVTNKAIKEKTFQKTKIFGSASWYRTSFIENLFSNVDQCGVGDVVKSHFPNQGDDSVASTIATQVSFEF